MTMGTISKLLKITLTIFFGINLQICVTANSLPTIETETPIKPDSPTLVSTSSNEDSHIDPLPADIFTKELSDFLSPDIFTQANPYIYFLNKTKNLSYLTIKNIGNRVWRNLSNERFPQRYIPYAEFVSSLLLCYIQLQDIKDSTIKIQRFADSTHPSMPPELFVEDPRLQQLFSPYVFSDSNPPARLLRKLTDIPENEISNMVTRLQNLLNHRNFPRRYSLFTKSIMEFFKNGYLLRNLKQKMVEIQRVVRSSIPQIEQASEPDDDFDPQIENANSLAQPPTTVDNSQKIIAPAFNNDSDANALPKKFLRSEVRNFLTPEMFSQTNQYAYFMAKAAKLPKDVLQQLNFGLIYSLDHDEFPRRYIPYAELATSLLSCLSELQSIEWIIDGINRLPEKYYKEYKLDPEVSKFFSDDVFYNDKPRFRILNILVNMSENQISKVTIGLQKLVENHFYPRFVNCLWKFLQSDYLLLRLKDNIAEIQRLSMDPQPTSISDEANKNNSQ